MAHLRDELLDGIRHCSRTNGEQWLILLNTRRGQDRDRKLAAALQLRSPA
jgi:hypothetical protein